MLKLPANKRVPKHRLFLVTGVTALFLVAGFLAYWLYQTNQQANTASTPTTEPTRSAESEGQPFPVPQSVPQDSVKNYALITENGEYKIRRDQSGNYLITLYPIANNPSQYGTYDDQLREYKQAALDYLKEKNVDLTKTEITYEPPEAANL